MPSRSILMGRRLLLAVVVVSVLGYAGYLASANLFLSSSLGDRVINRRPDRLRITWAAARTWWPGSVVLDGVTIAGANPQSEWQANLDHISVQLSMWRLPLRVLHTDRIVGEGLVFRLRDRLEPAGDGDGDAETDAALEVGPRAPGALAPVASAPGPPAPGVPAPGVAASGDREPAAVAPMRDAEPPRPRRWRVRQPWRLDLEGIAISGLREIAIGKSTLLGHGDLRGDLELELKGPLSFDGLALAFQRARFLQNDEPVGDDVSFALTLSSPPFEPSRDTAREMLSGVSGDVTLTAAVRSLGVLDLLLRKPDWLSFSGSGRLDTAFRFDQGEILPGGHLDFAAPTLVVQVLDWTAEGDGTIAVRLPESGEPAALLDADFGQFTVRRGNRAAAHVSGRDLTVAVEARALDLAAGFEGIDLRVDLPPSRVDLVAYNEYLPAGAFRIVRGRGTLRSWFEYSEDDGLGRGEVAIDVAGAEGVAGELDVAGDLTLRTVVRGGDFDALRFDVSGSTLALRNVRVARPGGKVESDGWWATIETDTARLDMKEPLEAEILVRGRMRDAQPLLTALATRRRTLFWLDDLIGVKDVDGRAAIDLGPDRIAARDIAITGDRLEIIGDIETRGGERDGLLYLKYGPLSAALEMAGTERDWKLRHPRRWFEERRRARAAPG